MKERGDFDFAHHALEFMGRAEGIIHRLPDSEAAKAFEDLILALETSIGK